MSDVFVAGSLRHAPREWWKIYENIAKLVKELGYTVHVPHIDTLNEINRGEEDLHNPDLDIEIRTKAYQANFEAIRKAKLMIAEVTRPSTGTGVEIQFAMQLKKKIICLANKDADVTSMILGPANLGMIEMIRYNDEEDALAKLRELLSNLSIS